MSDGILRPALEEDAEQLLSIYCYYIEETTVTFELETPSIEEMRRRIQAVGEKHSWLVYEEQKQVLGYAYSSDFHPRAAYQWTAEASVYVERNKHGAGIGTRLYQELLKKLAEQGYYNVTACLGLPNEASVAFHEAFGFRQRALFPKVGFKFNRWLDVGWWQLALREYTIPERAPLAVPERSGK